MGTASKLDAAGVPVVGAPKGIDNDISGTDVSLGYATSVNFGARAMRSTTVSARTHRRISVVEVMGRQAGWLSCEIGIAGQADVILIPERPVVLERVIARIGDIYEAKGYCSVIVAEGIKIHSSDPVLVKASGQSEVVRALLSEDPSFDEHGNPKLGGVGQIMRRAIGLQLSLRSPQSVRTSDLGFILRGLEPDAADIVLGTRFGIAAIDMLVNGKHGRMVGLSGAQIHSVQLHEALVQKQIDWCDQDLRSVGVCW